MVQETGAGFFFRRGQTGMFSFVLWVDIPWIVVIDLVQQRRVVTEEGGVAGDGHARAWVVGGERAVVVVDHHFDGAWARREV